jgi:hypothetical protein
MSGTPTAVAMKAPMRMMPKPMGMPCTAHSLVPWPSGVTAVSRLDSNVPMPMPPSVYAT